MDAKVMRPTESANFYWKLVIKTYTCMSIGDRSSAVDSLPKPSFLKVPFQGESHNTDGKESHKLLALAP